MEREEKYCWYWLVEIEEKGREKDRGKRTSRRGGNHQRREKAKLSKESLIYTYHSRQRQGKTHRE